MKIVRTFSAILYLIYTTTSSAFADIRTIGDVQNAIISRIFSSNEIIVQFENDKIFVNYNGYDFKGNYSLTTNPYHQNEPADTLVSKEIVISIDTLSEVASNIDPFDKVDLTDNFPRIVLSRDQKDIEKIVWKTHYSGKQFELY